MVSDRISIEPAVRVDYDKIEDPRDDLAPTSNNYQFAAGFSWYTKAP